MITNYIKIAIRNILKNKAFAFINIFGLALSLSVCLLVILLIQDSYTFDTFHPEEDRIYRLTTTAIRKAGGEEKYATSPFLVGKTLAEQSSHVEEWTPLMSTFNCTVLQKGNRISGRGLFTDASFFEVFGFELESGDIAEALTDPYSIVLTHNLAKKLFQERDPMGATLELPAYEQPFKVTGVLKAFPGKTHLEFQALGSLVTQQTIDQQANANNFSGNILNYYSTYNFVRLNKGANIDQVTATLSDIAQNSYEGLTLETRDKGYKFDLQALNDITPGPVYSNNMGRALPVQALWFFSVLSIIVILSACFNYTNLTIARSLTRAREVGIRKVLGASSRQVFAQFMCEASIMALCALGLAFLFLELTIPMFNSIQSLSQMDINLQITSYSLGLFFLFTLMIGAVAGFLPSAFLSRFSPLVILQQLNSIRLFRRIGLRKVLLVFQFAISLVFILVLTIAWKQVNFAVQKNFGADQRHVVNVATQNNDFENLRTVFGALSQVENTSGVSHLMGTWQDRSADVKVLEGDEARQVRDYGVDHQYIDFYDVELLAGESFTENTIQQQELYAVVNERFISDFELGTPEEAIGKTIYVQDSIQLSILGVTNNFLFKPIAYNIEPLLLRYQPENLRYLSLSLQSEDLLSTVAALERTWKKVDASTTLSYEFYDEAVKRNFAEIKDMANVMGYFGFLGLVIACLGLLGMAIYSVETKAKEISIRKIIGASSIDLIRQLSKGYFWLLVIACVLAIPLSILVGQQILQTFAFSIPLNLWVFIPGVLGLFILGLLTVGSQTIRAALANPVDNLRNE